MPSNKLVNTEYKNFRIQNLPVKEANMKRSIEKKKVVTFKFFKI